MQPSPPKNPVRVLLIEDNDDDVVFIEEILRDEKRISVQLSRTQTLALGLAHLATHGSELVLLDLSLPDSRGLASYEAVRAHTADVPVILLTGLDDEALASEAVQKGAQDYLLKGELSAPLLVRAMRYAIERNKAQIAVRSLAMTDELTGFYNRRGFMAMCEQQLRLAERIKTLDMVLLFVDLDGMKVINDTFGHQGGDAALVDAAEIMKLTLRSCDIIGRLGGDEFGILAMGVNIDQIHLLIARLHSAIALHNQHRPTGYVLGLSIGHVKCEPNMPVASLLEEADRRMYEVKRAKKR